MVQQASPSLSQRNESSTFPRLSINHLLLLTLTVGFSLACVAPSLAGILPDEGLESITTLVAKQFMVGIKLFGFIVVVRNWARSQSSTVAPGHWVFLALGPLALFLLLSVPVSALVHARRPAVHEAIKAIMFLAAACICGRAALQLAEWRWRACLAVLGGWLLNISLYFVLRSAEVYGTASYVEGLHHRGIWISHYVALAFIVVASILDAAKGVRRDWLHILAVFTILCDAINNAVMFRVILWQWWSELLDHFGRWIW